MGFWIILLICCLPALGALGHDIYIAYGENMDVEEPLQLSDIGWLWMEYSKETYDYMFQETDAATWKTWVAPILEQKAIVVGAIPAMIYLPVWLLLKLLDMTGGAGKAGLAFGFKKKGSIAHQGLKDRKAARFNYKRR